MSTESTGWSCPLPYHEFLAARRPATARTYRAALLWLDRFLAGGTLDGAGLLRFPTWLARQGLAPRSRATYLVAVRQFVAWLEIEDRLEVGPQAWSRFDDLVGSLARVPPPTPRAISAECITAMVACEAARPANGKAGGLIRLRNVAILETLRSTGCRAGEVVSMTRGDLDYVKQEARVIGKGGKPRLVFFDGPAWAAVERYLQARGDGGEARALSSYPVFARHGTYTRGGTRPITAQYLWHIVRGCAERAGVDEDVFPHAFRHSFAERIMDAQTDLGMLQDMLGHASPVTTRVYYKPGADKLRRAHRRAFDRQA